MAYDPGALNASLAAAVGHDSGLMAELKEAFVESARRQLDLLSRSRCDANWQIAAARLKSIAASFGVAGLIELSDEAQQGAPGDPAVLRKIAAALDEFAQG
ncbi:MAG TPA: Hpt domain-containing protein [Allosphingosinicella sp.]|nr:Hpt domain-containing protein [Allosphingosinicella sp.]